MVAKQMAAFDTPFAEFVEAMAEALDARDRYTAGHSVRVAEYSYALAQALNLPERHASTIRIAAQLHDIGKIGMPDSVLQKRGKLTAEEFEIIKLHPQIGRKILERVSGFGKYIQVVELHHENVDGTGYPYGLTGDQISLDARIVRVTDAFDAMTSDRSYRGSLTPQAALKEIQDYSGRHFDVRVAAAFLKLADKNQLYQPDTELMELARLREALSEREVARVAR